MIPNPPFHHSREHQAGPGIAGQVKVAVENQWLECIKEGPNTRLAVTASGTKVAATMLGVG